MPRPRGRRRRGGGGGGGGDGGGNQNGHAPEPQPWASAPEADRAWLPLLKAGDQNGAEAVLCGWNASCGHGKKRAGPCGRVCCFESILVPQPPAPAPNAPPALRAEGALVGMVNLGSTCYLNSLVQCLYAVPELRAAIYSSGADAGQKLLQELARLFARLADGMHAAVKPEDLIKVLGVDRSKQQDAQELLALLIAYLREQCGPAVKAAIDRLLLGSTAYVTTCSKCGRESEASHDWSMLQVPLLKSLEESLNSLLAPEPLQGVNQYLCENCETRVDASRRAVLKTLPPVLILQCMRFLYDVKIKDKKKVTSVLTFPRTLDLSHQCPNGGKYVLEGGVLHLGASAHGGHYIAHVKTAEGWVRLDDATASALPAGAEMEEPPNARPVKDRLLSATAYLLIYRRTDAPAPPPPPVPVALQGLLERDNQDLIRLNADYGAQVAKEAAAQKSRATEAEALLEQMKKSSKAGVAGRWISVDVLSAFISAVHAGTARPPLASHLCEHGAADPARLSSLRFMAEAVYQKINRNTDEPLPPALCVPCLQTYMTQRLALAEQARNRDRLIAENASASADARPYVVSKSALGEWRKAWPYSEAAAIQAASRLVKELQCPHGRVCSDGRKKEAVGEELWALLDSIYNFGAALSASAPSCAECEKALKEKRKEEERLRAERASLRKQFSLLVTPPDAPPAPGEYYLISGAWLEEWRAWLNAAEDAPEAEPQLNHSKLLCPHSQLLLPPLEAVASGAAFMPEALLAPLKERFPNAPDPPHVLISANDTEATPAACTQGCVAEARQAAEEKRFNFVDAELTVTDFDPTATSNAIPAAAGGGGERRSPRKRRGGNKNQLKVKASSTDTVAELKLKIFEQSDIAPAAQRLRLGSKVLEDNTLPLSVYCVPTGAVLTVEKVEGEVDNEDWISAVATQRPGDETAFENTLLLNSDTDESMEDRPQEWVCPACTFRNKAEAKHCDMCEAKRPS